MKLLNRIRIAIIKANETHGDPLNDVGYHVLRTLVEAAFEYADHHELDHGNSFNINGHSVGAREYLVFLFNSAQRRQAGPVAKSRAVQVKYGAE